MPTTQSGPPLSKRKKQTGKKELNGGREELKYYEEHPIERKKIHGEKTDHPVMSQRDWENLKSRVIVRGSKGKKTGRPNGAIHTEGGKGNPALRCA